MRPDKASCASHNHYLMIFAHKNAFIVCDDREPLANAPPARVRNPLGKCRTFRAKLRLAGQKLTDGRNSQHHNPTHFCSSNCQVSASATCWTHRASSSARQGLQPHRAMEFVPDHQSAITPLACTLCLSSEPVKSVASESKGAQLLWRPGWG